MKKLTALFLTLALCLSLCTVTALAAVTKPEGATWLVENQVWCQFTDTNSDTVADTLTIGGEGAMPDWLDGYGDKDNDNYYKKAPWWQDTETYIRFEHLVVQEGITSIGNCAFEGIKTLEDISLPQSLKTIGENAFYDCKGITAINLPSGLTSVGKYALGGTSITSLTVPASLVDIGQSAFQNLYYLTTLTIPNGIKTIGNSAFYQCGCRLDGSMNKIVLPNSVESIGNNAFTKSKVTEVVIPDSVKSIGKSAFSSCSCLTNVTLPKNADYTTINEGTFYGCTALTGISIPANVTEIGNNAFEESGLTEITIPKTVTSIGEEAFKKTKLSEITIPGTVKNIESSAFHSNGDLTKVTLEEGVESIGSSAFNGCVLLSDVKFPSSLKTIGSSAFWSCEHLSVVDLPEGLEAIGDSAFCNCYNSDDGGNLYGLSEVHIPASVTTIGDNAFSTSGNLQSVIVYGDTPATLGNNAFSNTHANLKIIVPAAAAETYKVAPVWINYADKIVGAYLIKTEVQGNGTVVASPSSVVAQGYDGQTTVTLTVTPNSGYKLKSLKWYTTDPTSATDITSAKSFTMPAANVTVTAVFEEDSTGGGHHGGSGNPTVTSPKTADMGVALYGVLTVSALLGMGWTAKRKR